MKRSIVALITLMTLSSFAQDNFIDYVFNYSEYDLEYIKKNNPLKEKYKLNSLEKKQVKVLKCLRRIAQKKKKSQAHIEAAQLVFAKLKTASSGNDLIELRKECRKLKNKTKKAKKSLTNKQLLSLLEKDPESRDLISKLMFVENRCVFKRVYVQGAVLIGAKIGLGTLTCQGSDARRRRYLAPSIGLATNFGANLGYEKVYIDNTRSFCDRRADCGYDGNQDKLIGKFATLTIDKTSNFSVIVGRSYVSEGPRVHAIDSSDISKGRNLGLSSITGSSINLGIRFLDGQSNWKELLQLLNN